MRLELSPFVGGDLEDIAALIALDNPRRAVSFIRELRAKFLELKKHPVIYRLRPDIGEDARAGNVGNYAILFRVLGDVVRIERIVFGGRDLSDIFDPNRAGPPP